jgi:Uncharacterized protein conserved in bacteria
MATTTEKIRFEARIYQVEGMNAGYIEFPFSVEELFGTRGQVKVKAIFDGKVEYRGSLANMGRNCHTLGLTIAIRQSLSKNFGETIIVELERDLEVREVSIPDDAQHLLNENPDEKAFFEKLSYTHRKEYINWITSAKREETRAKRLIQFIGKLQQKKKPDQK